MNGIELRELREKWKLTQTELGDLLGVAQNTVARWERDERAIPPHLPLALETIERRLAKKKTKDGKQ